MNLQAALEETENHPVLTKLEELAQAAGVEGAYAVDHEVDGSVRSVALLDQEGQNAEVVLRADGRFNVVFWTEQGWDLSKGSRHEGVDLEAFNEIVDERVSSLASAPSLS